MQHPKVSAPKICTVGKNLKFVEEQQWWWSPGKNEWHLEGKKPHTHKEENRQQKEWMTQEKKYKQGDEDKSLEKIKPKEEIQECGVEKKSQKERKRDGFGGLHAIGWIW